MCFIQHYLWDLSNAPDIRQWEIDSFWDGYRAVNHASTATKHSRASWLSLIHI